MKYTEIESNTYKISSLYSELILAKGPFQFTWGDDPFEPKEVVIDFTKEMSATYDLEIDTEMAKELWAQLTN